ncbi:periplasmic binding protein-like I, partial [Catenaria anguillulae PL171]
MATLRLPSIPCFVKTSVALTVTVALILAPTLAHTQQQSPVINLRIGSVFPFNSPDPQWRAEYVSSRESHVLGFKHAQEDGFLPNVNISIIERDATGLGRGDEGKSVYATLDVIKQGVVGILGGGTSTAAAQISMVSRTLRLPICSMIAGSSILSNKVDHPWFFRFLSSSSTMAKATIDFITQRAQWKQFSLLTESGNAFASSYSAEL